MSELRPAWTLSGAGWADCTVTDRVVEAVILASSITAAPRDIADIGYPQQKAAVDA